MKQTIIVLVVFAAAILFFSFVTGIAAEIQANGFNWSKIVELAKGEDNMIWSILPVGCVLGLAVYWIFNR